MTILQSCSKSKKYVLIHTCTSIGLDPLYNILIVLKNGKLASRMHPHVGEGQTFGEILEQGTVENLQLTCVVTWKQIQTHTVKLGCIFLKRCELHDC